jgi:hypothetical protein
MTAHCRIACARRDEDEDKDEDIAAEWPQNFLRMDSGGSLRFWAVSTHFCCRRESNRKRHWQPEQQT